MNTPVFTTAAALRAALAEAITCSPEELQEAIGQVVVAEASAMPLSARIGKGSRSLHDPESRTTALLADLMPAGQEATAIAQEIARWHGRAAVATLIGETAAHGAVIEDGSGAVLHPVDGFNVRMLRSGDRYGADDCLTYDNAEPSVEFYDATQSPEKFGPRGQFVNRYLASTLLGHSPSAGLLLDTGSPTWVVSAQAMRRVNEHIREELQLFTPDVVPVTPESRQSTLAVLKQKQIGVSDFVLATGSANPQIKAAIGTFEGTSGKGMVQLRLLYVLREWGVDGRGRPDQAMVQANHSGLGRYSDFDVEGLIKIAPGDVPALTQTKAAELLAMVGKADASQQSDRAPEGPSSAQLTSLSRRVADVANGSFSESALRDAEKVLRAQPATEQVVEGLVVIAKALRGEEYVHHALQGVAVGIAHLGAGRDYQGMARPEASEADMVGTAPAAKGNPFVTSETVHVAQVSYFWTAEKLHDTDYHLGVYDAVRKAVAKAVEKHDVVQNTSHAGQWEGVELFGSSLAAVNAAANDVARVLGRFKGVRPLPSEPENESSPSPGF